MRTFIFLVIFMVPPIIGSCLVVYFVWNVMKKIRDELYAQMVAAKSEVSKLHQLLTDESNLKFEILNNLQITLNRLDDTLKAKWRQDNEELKLILEKASKSNDEIKVLHEKTDELRAKQG